MQDVRTRNATKTSTNRGYSGNKYFKGRGYFDDNEFVVGDRTVATVSRTRGQTKMSENDVRVTVRVSKKEADQIKKAAWNYAVKQGIFTRD